MTVHAATRKTAAPTYGGCVRRITFGMVLVTCLFFVSSVRAQDVDELDCHMHGTERWCIGPDGKESLYPFSTTISSTATSLQATITHTDDHATETADHDHAEETGTLKNCHSHGTETWCTNENGEEVLAPSEENTEEEESHGENCHFHAGVEHCGSDEEITDPATQCVVSKRDYNRGIRIGAIFIVLVTSSIAVFGPLVISRFTQPKASGLIFTIIKQFGTGVIVATAFIHLLTHSQLLFGNPCIGKLGYEATSTAIAMAGIFCAFMVEYIGDRILHARPRKQKRDVEGPAGTTNTNKEDTGNNDGSQHVHSHSHGAHSHGPMVNEKLAVVVMEMGIIFHSILIGITLVVAGDSVFATLLVVIVFHQMFEGLALGTRIALLPSGSSSAVTRFLLASAFASITPIGMAIGVGVLNKFNGNDRETLITMATLDAVSAGILVWVGVVEMWAADWLNGEMRTAGPIKTIIGLVSLFTGMALMGLLGKWA